MLLGGGNAFDALVAAGFAAAVTEPIASYSLAAESVFMLYDAESGDLLSLSGQGTAPRQATLEFYRKPGAEGDPHRSRTAGSSLLHGSGGCGRVSVAPGTLRESPAFPGPGAGHSPGSGRISSLRVHDRRSRQRGHTGTSSTSTRPAATRSSSRTGSFPGRGRSWFNPAWREPCGGWPPATRGDQGIGSRGSGPPGETSTREASHAPWWNAPAVSGGFSAPRTWRATGPSSRSRRAPVTAATRSAARGPGPRPRFCCRP